MIVGHVVPGSGGASRAMVGDKLQDRAAIAGVPLVPGTLNVRVPYLDTTLQVLGPPVHESETDSRVGPLRWWPITLRVDGTEYDAFVVRHTRTRTRYLEIVADVRFRDLGVVDGTTVELARRAPGVPGVPE